MTTNGPRAPSHPIPEKAFYSIEYPGYVKPTSIDRVIDSMGGPTRMDYCFKHKKELIELMLQPDNAFAHPISGDIMSTSNMVLKVTKRKKKQPPGPSVAGPSGDTEERGQYTAKVAGITSKTVRFRSMSPIA